ncbi:hypothetical protein D3C86_1918860 [compost metagenome]
MQQQLTAIRLSKIKKANRMVGFKRIKKRIYYLSVIVTSAGGVRPFFLIFSTNVVLFKRNKAAA